MKKIICYLFHERQVGPWFPIGWPDKGLKYRRWCFRCQEDRYCKEPSLRELNRVAVVGMICIAILAVIGYVLKKIL